MKKESMENKNNTNNGIGSGFLLGILIGVILTLLITTKKGREILKDLMDRGIQKISDLEEAIDKAKHPSSSEEENDYIKPEPEEVKKEIRYLAETPTPEKVTTAGITVRTEKKLPPGHEEKPINEKGGLQKKLNKRLFFRRTQKKS